MSPRHFNEWRRSKSRERQRRPRRRRILIVCEGRETERNYFNDLKEDGWASANLKVVVKRGKGGSREQVAEHAVNRKNEADANEPYDEVWCVMDVEKATDRESCEKAFQMLARAGIEPCLSNPAFEVWLLSHFEKTTKPYFDCDAVVRDLDPHWRRKFNRDYDKADRSIYRLLAPLTDDAIKNARETRENHHPPEKPIIDCNAATEVHRFVERLLGRSE
jgi:hypothetical protein